MELLEVEQEPEGTEGPPERLPWLVAANKRGGSGLALRYLVRPCRTREEGQAVVDWLRKLGWYASVAPRIGWGPGRRPH